MSCDDERWMQLALSLAEQGRGAVEPNPLVGAVIVRDGEELGRGWHERFGGPHAEVYALQAAKQAGRDVRDATMYVTLEPCCHHGKTPPCTEAIIAAGIGRVVVAMIDPDPRVAGGGIELLRRAGIEVSTGACEAQAVRLLSPYVKLRRTGRPWVICKWAQTSDGYLAHPHGGPRWVSCEQSRQRVHELRAYCDGICVGINTVLCDDPLLTNRSGRGRQPERLVLDAHLRTPETCRLVCTATESLVTVATTELALAERAEHAARLRTAGVALLALPAGPVGVDLSALLDELGRRPWTYLLVEGGAMVLRDFIDQGLADQWMVFVSPDRVGQDESLTRADVFEWAGGFRVEPVSEEKMGRDRLLTFRPGG